MNDLETLDLESPARLSPDDNSSDAMIERADRKARSLRRVVTRRAEARLVEAALYYDEMVAEEQALFGRFSKYFFRKKRLEKSQMVILKKLILKHEEEAK